MTLDKDTVEKKCFISGKVLVLVKKDRLIPEELVISIDDELFTIKISVEPFSFNACNDRCRNGFACHCYYQTDDSPPIAEDSNSNSSPNHQIKDSKLSSVSNKSAEFSKADDDMYVEDSIGTPKSVSQEAALPFTNTEVVECTDKNMKAPPISLVELDVDHAQGVRPIAVPINDVPSRTQSGSEEVVKEKVDAFPVSTTVRDSVHISQEDKSKHEKLCPTESQDSLPISLQHHHSVKKGMQNTRKLEEIDEEIEEDWFRGLLVKCNKRNNKCNKRNNKKSKSCSIKIQKGRVADESLSDGDFRNRNSLLMKEAQETLEVSRMLGISFDCDDSVILEKLKEMAEEEC